MASADGINVYEVDADYDLDEEFGVAFDEEQENYRAMGVDPEIPTAAKPGSEEKVIMLAARYAAGLPLWHNGDCYDHGPNRGILAQLGAFDGEEEEEEE